MDGFVCRGPDRDGEPTYVLLRDWTGPLRPVDREEALSRLALRYLTAYGPAEPPDLAAWSGLGLPDARRAWGLIADRLREVHVGARSLWMPRSQRITRPGRPVIRLVPSFDPYLLAYRTREFSVDTRFARRVHPGGGVLHPTLLVDGRAVATWRSIRHSAGLHVAIEPFTSLDPDVEEAVEAEARDVARFLGLDLTRGRRSAATPDARGPGRQARGGRRPRSASPDHRAVPPSRRT